MDKASEKEKDAPKFVPEWLKVASNGGLTGGANSTHQKPPPSHLDEHGDGVSSRNRASRDDQRPSSRSSSSFRRSSGSNGSLSHDGDGFGYSRLCRNSGRGYRGRDRDRDLDPRDRDRTILLENFDSPSVGRNAKDDPRRAQTVTSGKKNESLPKRSGFGYANGVRRDGVSIGGGIGSKASFDREFPSLGPDEKPRPSEIVRTSSHGFASAIQSIPIGNSDGWSALAEVPSVIGGGANIFSSGLPTVPVSPTSTSGLNMAETVAQAPARVCNTPQLSVESQRIEELNRRQCVKLIPLTPSMPKNSASKSSEKSKLKGTKGDLAAAPRVSQQTVAQVPTPISRSTAVSDTTKSSSSSGNFQLLNWEKHGISPPTTTNGQSTSNSRMANPIDGKGLALPPVPGLFGENKTKNRNDFFDAIRKQAHSNHSSGTTQPENCEYPGEKKPPEVDAPANPETAQLPPDSSPLHVVENGDCVDEAAMVDPKEKAFLESLGWIEDGEAAALTASEVAEFMEKNRERMPSSKLNHLQRIACHAFGLSPYDIEREA